MPFGLLAGLSAALAWGTTDLVSALASRRIGSLLVATGVTVVSAAWFVLIALVVRPAREIDIAAYGPSILVGLLGAGGYMSFYSGLRVGPIAVVSGVVAAYGGLTVVLSVLLRGETLTVLQAAGAAIATIGVILTGIAFSGGPRGTRFAGPGVVFAVIALVLFAVMAITTDIALYSADALQVLLIYASLRPPRRARSCRSCCFVAGRWPCDPGGRAPAAPIRGHLPRSASPARLT